MLITYNDWTIIIPRQVKVGKRCSTLDINEECNDDGKDEIQRKDPEQKCRRHAGKIFQWGDKYFWFFQNHGCGSFSDQLAIMC